MTPARLMDNHKGALRFWQELGIQAATCVHVDAHLDVSNFPVPEPGELENAEINCGNFLLPAMETGIVTWLIWVLPPHLYRETPFLEWAQEELQNWMWLTLAEYQSLHLDHGRVEGTLAGRRLTLCTADNLPPVGDGPVLVDIDVDYFFGPDDELWQTPGALCQPLSQRPAAAVTVATSLEGGYTPPRHAYVGELCVLYLTGHEAEATRLWDALQAGRPLHDAPPWYEGARQGLAASRDYEGPVWAWVRPLDVACFHLQRKRYAQCLPWLDRVGRDPTAQYLRALIAFRQGDHARAEALWGELAGLPQATGMLGAHLLEMRGKAQAARGAHAEALASFQGALKLTPGNASLWRQAAREQVESGAVEQACRSLRKAVALAPDHLATRPARYDLARLYLQAGQVMLAQAEVLALVRSNGPLADEARQLASRMRLGV